jgi:hypothetical protein
LLNQYKYEKATGKGRAMSWEGWEKRNEEMVKTGTGLKDLLIKLQSE